LLGLAALLVRAVAIPRLQASPHSAEALDHSQVADMVVTADLEEAEVALIGASLAQEELE